MELMETKEHDSGFRKYGCGGLFLLSAILALVVCKKEPEIPEPATPKGLSFQIQDGSILFSWFPAEDALSYGMEIAKDSELSDLIHEQEGIADTFQLVSCDSFNFDSTYYWRVRAEGEEGWGEWSDVASFTYSSEGGLDLDTTYFPFGLGYEWCYARRSWQVVSDPGWETWYRYDTFIVKVVDSFWKDDSLYFQLDRVLFGLSNPVKIWHSQILLFWDSIPLIPESYTKETDILWGGGVYNSSYRGDTLRFTLDGPGDPYDEGWLWYHSVRLPGIGAINHGESYSGSSVGVQWDDGFTDNLIYFYNGKDTVYKADDWGEVLDIDLDTTYFPLGEGYQWTYQRHSWGEKSEKYTDYIWDEYDTITVSVSDSFWRDNIMMIGFSGEEKPFYDVGDPVKVLDGKVQLQTWSEDAITPWVNPHNPPSIWPPISIGYLGDTLKIEFGDAAPGGNPYDSWYHEWTMRLQGVGPILQGSSYWGWDSGEKESYTRDSLIRFTTPEGQVWP